MGATGAHHLPLRWIGGILDPAAMESPRWIQPPIAQIRHQQEIQQVCILLILPYNHRSSVARIAAMRRDLSCFGDDFVTVSATSVSGCGGCGLDRSLQPATTSACLSSRKEVLVRVTWTRSTAGAHGLTVAFDEQSLLLPSRSATQNHVMRRKRGSRSVVIDSGTAVGVHWDVTAVEYASSSDPSAGDYCLAVVVDAELALLLGAGDLSSKFASAYTSTANVGKCKPCAHKFCKACISRFKDCPLCGALLTLQCAWCFDPIY